MNSLYANGQNILIEILEQEFNKKIQIIENTTFITNEEKKIKILELKKQLKLKLKEIKNNLY